MNREFTQKMTVIVDALRKAGYDPYSQLSGYIRTKEARYITRTDNARELIRTLETGEVEQFVKMMDR